MISAKRTLPLVVLFCAGAAASCADSSGAPANPKLPDVVEGGAGAGAGTGSADDVTQARCRAYYANYSAPFSPSFEIDVMPRLQVNCNTSSCHGGDPAEARSALWLGPNQDASASAADRKRVLSNLEEASLTAFGMPLVTPGKPAQSFLMLKLDSCHADAAFDCEAQPTPVGDHVCGDSMPPPGSPPLSESDLEVFRSWISQGALNN